MNCYHVRDVTAVENFDKASLEIPDRNNDYSASAPITLLAVSPVSYMQCPYFVVNCERKMVSSASWLEAESVESNYAIIKFST